MVIDVRMRDVVAYVTVSPAVVGCARGSDTCVTSQVATVQLQVLLRRCSGSIKALLRLY